MGQLVGCIKGIGAACQALDMPIVSGNVSLYNETDGRAILPTPTIGGVGLLGELDELIRMAPRAGDAAGAARRDARASRAVGAPGRALRARGRGRSAVDLAAERAAGEFVRAANAAGAGRARRTTSSDGGLAVAAAEMALAAGIGVEVLADEEMDAAGWFFGEDQGRYLVACPAAEVDRLLARAVEATGSGAGSSGRPAGIGCGSGMGASCWRRWRRCMAGGWGGCWIECEGTKVYGEMLDVQLMHNACTTHAPRKDSGSKC